MCIFTGPVSRVSKTRIFGRVDGTVQYVVYEMNLDTSVDVAMVLPVPVARRSGADAMRFVNLSRYKSFFEEIDQLFPKLVAPMSDSWSFSRESTKLRVQTVGAYDASYIPNVEAFSRLDERFRLSAMVWNAFPHYADYGFAVFQLRQGAGRFHPMAFAFSTRDPSQTFFPTMHVHDSKVHATAKFDHVLYAQTANKPDTDWITSKSVAGQIPGLRTWWGHDRSKGIISEEAPMNRLRIVGLHKNADVWVAS